MLIITCRISISTPSAWRQHSEYCRLSIYTFPSYPVLLRPITFRSPCSLRAAPCLWAVSQCFLWCLVNYSVKHDWPGDWITRLIDQWARKKGSKRPLKPKCDLNDKRAEQPGQADTLSLCIALLRAHVVLVLVIFSVSNQICGGRWLEN